MPSSSVIATSGSSAATSTTKSKLPLGSTVSKISVVTSERCSSNVAMTRGRNPRFTSFRSRLWSGGSVSMIVRKLFACSSGTSRSKLLGRADEYVSQSRFAATTSGCRVSTQKWSGISASVPLCR